MDSNCVQDGDKVIFNRNGACRSFQIRKNRQVYFEKNKFSVEELIGQPYGSTFELEKGKLIKVDRKKLSNTEYGSTVQDPTRDNRDLQDVESNQKMSTDDIMKLKSQGATGETIIKELIENSETFKTKTEFSQAKFLKKKKSKHIVSFTVLRPTPRLVLSIFFKEPQKICNLRADTLSQMLSFSNIMCGQNVAVVETCQGLLLSCVLQRLGGQGKIIQFVPNSSNPVCRQVMDFFPFSKEELDNVYSFPMSVLDDLKENFNSQDFVTNGCNDSAEKKSSNEEKRLAIEKKEGEMTKETTGSMLIVDGACQADQNKSEGGGDLACKEDNKRKESFEEDSEVRMDVGTESKPFIANREIQRRARAIRHKEAADLIMSQKLDSLLIACKYNPIPIVKKLLSFLPLSRSVVVFSPFLEPLVEIYTFVKENHVGLQVKLSETWLREYQVLPQRTHPMMNMSGTGGYLLTFITCDPATT